MPEHEDVPPSQRPTERIPREAPNRPPPAPEIEAFPDEFLEPTEAMPVAEREPLPVAEREPLPSIEELTFQSPAVGGSGPAPAPPEAAPPPDDHRAVRIPAPRPFPVGGTKVLSKKRFATLQAFAETLLPHGGPISYSATEIGVAERLDAAMVAWDRDARKMFLRFLGLLEWSSIFSRHLRGFSKLKPQAAATYLDRAQRSKLLVRRGAIDLLKFYVLNQWASTPRWSRGTATRARCSFGSSGCSNGRASSPGTSAASPS